MKLKPIEEQVVVVTGSSSGIGLATVRLAASRGAKVFLIARNEAALREAVQGIRAEGGDAAYATADVGDEAEVLAAAQTAIARFGRIDSWVNNAGVAIYAPLLDTPEEEHQRLFRTNYFGTVHGCRTAIRHLRENGGALVTVGSIAGDMPSPILGAYTASKHALKAYVESLRIEVRMAALPVSISLVKPSGIATPIAEHAANHLEGEARIPPPPYDPALVAEAILDCCTRRVREVTVGGVGRAQALFAQHFPALFDRLAPLVAPLLHTDTLPKTRTDNLAKVAADGEERSATEVGKPFSLYTSAARHPGLLAAGLTATALLVYAGTRRRRG
ncbi:SDR family oxidoreductase [Sphingomonas sp. ID0503]|uniref:SDR family oxidoreductase n=1 Tax=Sphingomonas sp. ID0503 TaxID=3399691 RepID=UPI003AFB7081